MRSVTANSQLQYQKSVSTFMKDSSNHASIKKYGEKKTINSDETTYEGIKARTLY